MKLIDSTPGQLELHEGATSGIITGGVFILLGIGGALSPLLFSLPWWASLIGLAVIALGVLALFGATSRDVILRSQGDNTITTKRVIGGKSAHVSFASTDVAGVRLTITNGTDTTRDSDGDTRTERYRLSDLRVTLTNGSEVEIGSEKTSSNGGISVNGMSINALDEAPLKDEGEKIAQLFGKQLQVSTAGDFNPADIPTIVNTVRESIASVQTQTTPSPNQTQQPVEQPQSPQQPQMVPGANSIQDPNSNQTRI